MAVTDALIDGNQVALGIVGQNRCHFHWLNANPTRTIRMGSWTV